jgi:GTP:adenosylcobinamide-phosphate guanylyltransferase
MLISFPNTPRISLDVKILGGEVTKVPFLRTEITSMLQKSIEEQLVWPRRNVIPTMDRGSIILERSKLLELQKTDPLLVAEQELMNSNQTLVKEVRERVMKETGGGNKNNTISLLDEEEAIDTEAVPTNSTGSWINDGLGKVKGWFNRQQQKQEDDSIASPGDVSNMTSTSYLERANGTLAVTSSENNIMAEIGTGFSNAFESVCKFFQQKDSADNKVEDGNKANGAEGKLAPQS